MFPSRLLVILSSAVNGAEAESTVSRALATAVRPASLRFALPNSVQCFSLPECVQFYDASLGWQDAVGLLSDETHFLLLGAPYAFVPRWDAELHRALRRLGSRALLTGSISPCEAPAVALPDLPEELPFSNALASSPSNPPKAVIGSGLRALKHSLKSIRSQEASQETTSPQQHALDSSATGTIRIPQVRFPHRAPTSAQPYLPALREALGDDRVLIGRGLPIVCAKAPIRTLVVDPALLMGPAAFLSECDLNPDTLSMAAYVSGFTLYALPSAWLWPVREPSRRELHRPPRDVLPGTTVARFEQLVGFRYGSEHPVGKAAMGLFNLEDTYEQRMPLPLLLAQKARALRLRAQEKHLPLMVAAFVDLPAPAHSEAFYRLRFGFLRRVESLPLILYTQGAQERALRASFPHCFSFPEMHLKQLRRCALKPAAFLGRSKPMLMQHAAQRHAGFSHVAWVDMDILPHPLCPDAVPDLEPLMDDRIHLATVNGEPDLSFVLVPTRYLAALARETLSITQLDCELKRGTDETLLWERLFLKKPEWFVIHRMPRRRLFFLSLFDKALFSEAIRPGLSDLPEPYVATQNDAKEMSEA